LRIFSPLLRQKLHRHGPSQPDVLPFINNSHTAGAELAHDPVVGHRLTDHAANRSTRNKLKKVKYFEWTAEKRGEEGLLHGGRITEPAADLSRRSQYFRVRTAFP